LLIAGLASDGLSWVMQRDALAQHYRVITCDNRGVGRSAKPAGPYTVQEMADDIVQGLDRLAISKFSLLGHSLGGALAQQIALTQPQRVERLMLACSFSHLQPHALAILESWSECLALGAGPDLMGKCLFPWLYSQDFLNAPGTLESALQALRAHPYPLDSQGLAGQVAALRRFDSRPQLSKILAPTLVLAAERDSLVSLNSCQTLAEAIPQAQFRVLPKTAHACLLETPEAFNEAILHFTTKL
jgi:pimeloyl-ACP methyl ester carboxylesterase